MNQVEPHLFKRDSRPKRATDTSHSVDYVFTGTNCQISV
jgi:hypothetical protein